MHIMMKPSLDLAPSIICRTTRPETAKERLCNWHKKFGEYLEYKEWAELRFARKNWNGMLEKVL